MWVFLFRVLFNFQVLGLLFFRLSFFGILQVRFLFFLVFLGISICNSWIYKVQFLMFYQVYRFFRLCVTQEYLRFRVQCLEIFSVFRFKAQILWFLNGLQGFLRVSQQFKLRIQVSRLGLRLITYEFFGFIRIFKDYVFVRFS